MKMLTRLGSAAFLPFTLLALLPLFSAEASGQAQAAASHSQVSLTADQTAYEPGRALWVGVLFHLDPGWHIYWQDPGDSGTPPKIDWMLPQGFSAGALKWPVPVRLGSGSIIDYGYQNNVLLMAAITTPAGAKGNAFLGADVHYVVCRELCIPEKAHLTLSVAASPDHGEHFSASHPVFEATRQNFPKPAPPAWKVSAKARKDNFTLAVRGLAGADGITFFPADTGVIDNPSPQKLSRVPGGFTLTLKKSDLLTGPVKTLAGLLKVPGQGSFEIRTPVVPE
jgi:DsbC/DsbD-like thiol-disulfide interchange protein